MSWLSSLFSPSQKRDTTYTGTKPVTTLQSVTGGPEYYNAISRRLGGQDVGYGDEFANQASNPIIKRMQSNFKSYELPELYSELSASGRRRSSGGFDQIRRAYQEQGLAEGDVYSGLYRENEGVKRKEISDALARMGAYAADEANLVGQRADFDMGDYKNQLSQANSQKQEGNAAFGRLLGTAALGIQGIGGMSGMGGGGGTSMMSQNYAPQQAKYMYPGVQTLSSRMGQQGGISPWMTRIK